MFTLALVAAFATVRSASKASGAAVGAIAFSVQHGDGDAPWDIYIVRTDGQWVSRKQTRLNEDDPVWSPDGRHIAYFAWECPGGCSGERGWVYTMSADGTHRRRLARGSRPQWSPDGRRIASAYDGIYVMNADGSGKKRLTRSGVGEISDADEDPVWSPDGKQIAFSRLSRGGFDVYVVDATGGPPRRLTRSHHSGVEAWSPGRQVILTREAVGAPSGIYIVNPDGSGLRKVVSTGPYNSPTMGGWSPDGQLILYAYGGISTVRPSDGFVRRLTRDAEQRGPAWSPDGRQIAFARSQVYARSRRDPGIWIVNRDGTGAHRIANSGEDPYRTAWAPR